MNLENRADLDEWLRDHAKTFFARRTVFGWFNVIVLAMLGSFSSIASANCSYANGTSATTLLVPLQGTVTVGRDVPIGQEIYRTYAFSSAEVDISCSGGEPISYKYITLPYPKAAYTDPKWGNNAYQTNVPGVGVVGWAADKAMPAQYDTTPSSIYLIHRHYYYFSFIKIGPVGAGTISAANLPTLQYVAGNNQLIVQNGGASGSFSIVARTCTTPDVTVDMGTHFTNELKGVGTSTPSVDASFTLHSCPAFYGYPSITANNGSIGSGSLGPNSVDYKLDPTTSVIDGNNGIFALASGGATGMGIQLLNSSDAPIKLSTRQASGLTLTTVDGASYTVPLKARYYQTAGTVTAGQANSAITVTLYYN